MSVELALSYPVRRFLLYLVICAGFWNLIEVPSEGVTSLTVMWYKSPDTNVQGYKLYYGTTSQQYTNSIVAGNVTNALAAGITPGVTYYFAVTSYDAAGWESSYSPEISYTVPLNSPAGTATNAALTSAASTSSGFNFSVNGTAASLYVVVASTNLTYWAAVATNASPFVFTDNNASRYSRRFYKAILASAYVPQVVPAQPVTSPPLSSPTSAPGGFTFTVNNTAGASYVIVASTNLTFWVAIGTNTAPFAFTDTNSSKFSRRFYKAILQSAYVPQVALAPPAAPTLRASNYSIAGFSLSLTGTPGSFYVVEVSTNLVNWVPVLTNVAPFNFVDSNASKFSCRFYQAVPLP
jgi:hypothetical protein